MVRKVGAIATVALTVMLQLHGSFANEWRVQQVAGHRGDDRQ